MISGSIGTGFVVANNAIATAGHNAYKHEYGGWPEYIKVYPGVNRSYQSFGNFNSVILHVQNNWIINKNNLFDLAVIEVNNNIGLRTGLYGYSYNNNSYNGINVRIDGYPNEKYRQQWSMSAPITSSASRTLYYKIDTTEGQIRSPVCLSGGTNAIAIHTRGNSNENRGMRITPDIFDLFNSFRK